MRLNHIGTRSSLRMDRLQPVLGVLLAGLLLAAAPGIGSAQRVTVSITPPSGQRSSNTVSVHIEWCATVDLLDQSTMQVTQNNSDISSQFDYNASSKPGCYSYAYSDGTVT